MFGCAYLWVRLRNWNLGGNERRQRMNLWVNSEPQSDGLVWVGRKLHTKQ